MVEGFNRTLKTRMWKYFTAKNNHVYIDILQDIVHWYNNSYHRRIGRAPASVSLLSVGQVRRKLHGKSWTKPGRKFKFKVGDQVRISKSQSHFHRRIVFPHGVRKFSLSPRLFQEFHQCIGYEIMLTMKLRVCSMRKSCRKYTSRMTLKN